jgi:hypothetical protein
MGFILYLFLDRPVARLVRTGAVLLLLQCSVSPPLLLSSLETSAKIAALERSIPTEGSFLDAVL